jgi:adenine deaminase
LDDRIFKNEEDTVRYEGNIVDPREKRIYPATIVIEDGKISEISESDGKYDRYIMPGFVDAHIHIESSMLPPYEFSRLATPHGTVATISDPHEIANVLGMEGVSFMIENGLKTPMKILFGASPCVPATPFETSGAKLGPEEVSRLLDMDGIGYLSEVMNYPGVVSGDSDMMKKIAEAKKRSMPIDGHAPGLRGADLEKYISAGIETDHESYTLDEAREKLVKGMKIIIREGSAAKNFDALHPLITQYSDRVMFCSDDRHPNDLMKGHIDTIVRKSLSLGYDLFDVLKIASINPVEHYGVDVGTLRVGDRADFIVVGDLKKIDIIETVIDGEVVARNGKSLLPRIDTPTPNRFATRKKRKSDFYMPSCREMEVIQALDHELITHEKVLSPGEEEDIAKIAVINRYADKAIKGLAHIEGFGLACGAMASSVAHDSHNIVVVGKSDEEMKDAVNLVISSKGGISAVCGDESMHLPLPIAGLMSDADGAEVALRYEEVERFVKERLGSTLESPFMTLSFMALLVIPELKLSDRGLFDSRSFHFISPCR